MLFHLHRPAVVLAALLQVLPLARTLITNPATGSTFAIILRWGIGAGAVVGSVDAVSGATSLFTSPTTFSGAVGTYFTNNVSATIGGGNTASSSDYFLVNAGIQVSPKLANGQVTTVAMPPGLSFKPFWVNGTPTMNGAIYGTPTAPGSYPVSITCGSPGNGAISTTVTITISGSVAPTAPAITGQPAAANVIAGKNATFTVTASGTAPLTYYWAKNGTALANAGNVSGANTATLTLTGVTTADAGNYSVLVSNAVSTVTSTAAALTVITPPVITSSPAPQTQAVGSSANFSVTANGSAPLNYFWLKNGATIANGTKYTGVNVSNLTVAALTTADAGNFSVIITNLAGGVTSSIAPLTVVSSPTITTPPANVAVIAGANAAFTVTAAGSTPLFYQWLKNSAPLANGGNISGAATATLSISAATSADAAGYSVTVSNALGAVTSTAATLTVAIPPAITTAPVGATILAGSNVTFTVTATGTAPLAYQWLKNGGVIAGATAATLTLTKVSATDAANYSVTVTNAVGSATSSSAALTVLVPPAITAQPANISVTQGNNAAISVTATGTAPLSFQWLKNGVPIVGANSNVLTLSVVTTNDAASYSVVVTNSVGTLASSSATLTVLVPPTILSQPVSATILAGSNVTFTVVASGTPPLTYQWQKNGGNIPGATTATLTLANVSAADTASYAVVVSNATTSVTSSSATLTVLIAPAITTQPANVSVTQGNNASFTVTATGTAPLNFQWLKNGVPVAGANSNVLTLSVVTTNDAASYSVVVTNIVGTLASSSATLTVLVPPTILSQPASVTVTAGSAAAFAVTANSATPMTYQWRKNGVAISGATAATLTFGSATTADAASYSVVVSNSGGSITSANAVLTVQVPPSITTPPANQFGALGSPIVLAVTAAGTGPLSYQWFQAGVPLAEGGNISGSTSNILTIAGLTTNEVASYFVVVTNVIGSVTSTSASVSVNIAPIISSQPASQFIAAGSSATLTVTATGSNPLTFQWLKNGRKFGNSATVSGATSNTLTLTKTALKSSGNYSVIVKNIYGSATSVPAQLTVLTPPTLAAAPRIMGPQAGGLAKAGANATLAITVKGSAPLSYQWFKNGVALTNGGSVSGANANVLKITALTTNDTAAYHVVGSNPVGTAASGRIPLTVFVAPVITSQPVSKNVYVGRTVSFSASATGTAPMSFQWYKGKKAVAGATNFVFVIANVQTTDAGTYSAIAKNFAGNATSVAATLTVLVKGDGGGNDKVATQNVVAAPVQLLSQVAITPPPLVIGSILQNADGSFTLNCSGTPGTNYLVEASADLAAWTGISTNTADANGQWQITDATRAPSRFYRLKTAP